MDTAKDGFVRLVEMSFFALMGKGGEMEMKNPYQKPFDDVAKALATQTKMIAWIAERTLSVKDYKEFIDEFAKKTMQPEENEKERSNT